jgi:signal transduction histidine kinase
VYFCCLEALQNCSKYARASEATIRLRLVGSELSFSVVDDGVGFEPDLVRRGLGLRSMQERVEALGGALEIRSSPGEGATISGRIPC